MRAFSKVAKELITDRHRPVKATLLMMDFASTVSSRCHAVVTIVSFAYFSRATGLTRKHENFLPWRMRLQLLALAFTLIGWLTPSVAAL